MWLNEGKGVLEQWEDTKFRREESRMGDKNVVTNSILCSPKMNG